MTHRVASEYFHSFCYAHCALENYNFVRAVQRFHEVMHKKFQVVNQTYIVDDAEEQICVDSEKRRRLLALYDENRFAVDSFDLYRRDIIHSLQRQVFANLLCSKWSSAYAASVPEINYGECSRRGGGHGPDREPDAAAQPTRYDPRHTHCWRPMR